MHLRVLLVEADDSTRQIIAALLRKCGYKVAAVGDGSKAWETLKERGKHIDIVLAEVELPSLAGFCLLTAIMEHESWRNIPVIMMSSQDSASVVFKCMLQGAADFLSKPIRKNELKNLWQHVWRRQTHPELHGNQPRAKVDSLPQNYSFNNENSENGLRKHKGSFEEENETKRYCIKSETNVGTPYMSTKSSASPVVGIKEASKEDKTVMYVSHLENERTHYQDELKRLRLETSHYDQGGDIIEEEEKPFREDKTSVAFNEAMNLIAAIDKQPGLIHRCKALHFAQVSDSAACPVGGKGVDFYISTSHPLFELSLKSSYLQGSHNYEKGEKNGWNHSSASAFSWYCNNSEKRIIQHGDFKLQGSIGNNNKVNNENQILDDASGSHHGEPEVDSVPSRGGALVQPVFYGLLEPRFPVDSAESLVEVQSSPNVHSWQYICSYVNNVQPHQLAVTKQNETSTEEGPTCGGKENKLCHYGYNFQLDQSAIQVNLSMTNQNTSSTEEATKNKPTCGTKENSILYCGSTNLPSANDGEANDSSMNNVGATPAADTKSDERQCPYKTVEGEEMKKISPREAALAKFRMKKKDRCFVKKVRYESRQRLAGQRPRVKGQFARRQVSDISSK